MADVGMYFDETGFSGTVGSDEAWAHVVAWEDSLPEDQYHTIHQLVANGWEDDLPGLEEDIRSAMEAEPPDPEVETTLNEFLSTLEDRGEDDTALAISMSEEPEDVVLDLPPIDGSVHTVDLDHPESWEGVPVLHNEDPTLNVWSDAARAASIEARRRSGLAGGATASIEGAGWKGKDIDLKIKAQDHIREAELHRNAADYHDRQASKATDPLLMEEHQDAAVGHIEAAEAHIRAAEVKAGRDTVQAKLSSDRAHYEAPVNPYSQQAADHASQAVKQADAGKFRQAIAAHGRAAESHDAAASGGPTLHRAAAEAHRKAARTLGQNFATMNESDELVDNVWSDAARTASIEARKKSVAANAATKKADPENEPNSAHYDHPPGPDATSDHHRSASFFHRRTAEYHESMADDATVSNKGQHSSAAKLHRIASKAQAEVADLKSAELKKTHNGLTGNARKKLPSQQLDITPEKACKILKDGEVRGHPLTERQRGLFGVICGRRGKRTANSELDSITSNEGSEKLPASAYAYVPHAHRPSTWKLRIDGPKHVSASIAALSKAGIPAGHLSGIKKKLRAAWRKFFPDKAIEDMPELIRNVEYDQSEVDYELALDELSQMVEDGELPGEVFNMIPGAPGPMSEPAYSVAGGPQKASEAAIKARDASRKAHEASLRTSASPLESRMALDAADRALRHAQSGNLENAREDHRGASAAHLSASAHHKLLSSPGPVPAPDSGLVAHAKSQMLPSISGVLATPLPTLEGDGTATRSAQSDLGTVIDMTGLASAHSNASGLHEEAADLHADAYDELEPAPTSGITLPEDEGVTLSEDGSITLSQDETPGTLLSMWPDRARIATASSRRAHMATASIEGVSKGSMKESAEAVSDADEAENASRDENLRGHSNHKSAMKAHKSLATYHKTQADKASKAGNKAISGSHTTASQLHEEAATAHDDAYAEAVNPLSNEVYDPDLGLLKTD